MSEKFYFCGTCGNLLFAAIASGVTPDCCGEEMTELQVNQEEGVGEKHLPEVETVDCCSVKVKIGSELHPMSKEHGIRFICVETDLGVTIRYLKEDESPEVVIRCNGIPKKVYAYCNKHGLWCKDLHKEKVCKRP